MNMEQLLSFEISRKLFERADEEILEKTRAAGCQEPCCTGALHRSDYLRHPRGFGPIVEEVKRPSLCCAAEGCRKRNTPPSLRFLNGKIYEGIIVVLLVAMNHGVNQRRADELREKMGIDKRTLLRWRTWWLENFTQSVFWREVKGNFPSGLDESIMPLCLVEAFEVEQNTDGLLKLMKFLTPISTGSLKMAGGLK